MERVSKPKLNFDPSTLFIRDESGIYHADPKLVPWDRVFDRVEALLQVDEIRAEAERVAKGVELEANIPAGNTAVIDGGYELFGVQPYRIWSGEKAKGRMHSPTAKEARLLRKRNIKCYEYYGMLLDATKSFEPKINGPLDEAAYLTNLRQIKTGGGFDNLKMGVITKSALRMIRQSIEGLSGIDWGRISPFVIQACLDMKENLMKCGMRLGSLRVYPVDVMRLLASKDGLIPFPMYAHGFDPYTKEMDHILTKTSKGTFSAAKAIGTDYHVAATSQDGDRVKDCKYPLIAALKRYIVEVILNIEDCVSTTTTLERVQKSGFKDGTPPPGYPDYGVVQKDGKGRSVSPTEAVPGVIESIVCVAFNEEIRRLKVPNFPSVQGPEIRHSMYKTLGTLIKEMPMFELMDIDFDNYDKYVLSDLLATMLQLVVKPFFNKEDWVWVDLCTLIACYKTMLIYAPYVDEASDDWKFICDMNIPKRRVGDFWIIALWSGLMSGMKGTHITFGSMYNLIYGQRAPMLMWCNDHQDYPVPPLLGLGAGDDVGSLFPSELIVKEDPSKLNVYLDYIRAFKLEINEKKFTWEFIADKDGKYHKTFTFLQEINEPYTDIYGIGSAGRSAAGAFIKERPTHLSVGDQARAVIAKMENGWNDPMAATYVRLILECSPVLLYVFTKYGAGAYQFLVEHSSMDFTKWCEIVGIDDYYWGASLEDVRQGKLRILPIFVDVAKDMGDLADQATSSKSVRLFLESMEDSQATLESENSRSDYDLDDFE